MRRALDVAVPTDTITFEVDSMLVARQILVFGVGKFACRSGSLLLLFSQCVELGRSLESQGNSWKIRHIYREYNQTADALANEAIDVGSAAWSTPT